MPLLFLIFDGGDYKLFINLTSHSARIIEVLVSLDSEYLFFARPKKRYEKKGRPDIVFPNKNLGIPSQLHDFLRSRKQDFLSWFRLFERPVHITLKSCTCLARYKGGIDSFVDLNDQAQRCKRSVAKRASAGALC